MKVQITIDVFEGYFDDPENITIEEVQEMAKDDYREFLEDADWVILEQ